MTILHRILLGSIGGVVATGPMTVAMILLHRRLPRHERYPLPPREITMALAHGAGIDGEMSGEARSAATLAAHFGYGAAAGAIYAAVTEPRGNAAGKGLLCGVILWLVSYLGWLPAVGILSPASEHPARRNALMIAVHLVWGTVLSAFVSLLAEESESRVLKPFSADAMPHRDVKAAS